MIVLNDRNVLEFAWVLEYVAEKREANESSDSVVFPALRLIKLVKEQLSPEEIAEIEDYLQSSRTYRDDTTLWNSDAQEAVPF